eukprot:Gb_34056 [translate_table: standard]
MQVGGGSLSWRKASLENSLEEVFCLCLEHSDARLQVGVSKVCNCSDPRSNPCIILSQFAIRWIIFLGGLFSSYSKQDYRSLWLASAVVGLLFDLQLSLMASIACRV